MLNVFTLKNSTVQSTNAENLNDSPTAQLALISRVSHLFLDLGPHPVHPEYGLTMHVGRWVPSVLTK